MWFVTRFSLFILPAALGLAACGLDLSGSEPDPLAQFDEVPGEAAVAAVGQVVGEVVSSLGDVMSSTNIDAPDSVQPESDVFETEAASGTAPGFAAQSHYFLKPWEGPVVGPDGENDWYYREATYTTQWGGSAVTPTVRYWFRTEPAQDIREGFDRIAAKRVHYAWTGEAGPWSGWTYLVEFGVTKSDTDLEGKTVAREVEGSWSWRVDTTAKRHRGSEANGTFLYTLLGLEGQEGERADEERFEDPDYDPYFGLAVGESRTYDLNGTSEYAYDGTHYNVHNTKVSEWFGGGTWEWLGQIVGKRTGEKTLRTDADMKNDGNWYWGTGQRQAGVDYVAEPAFSEGVTPPGDLWGVPPWGESRLSARGVSDQEERDGLLYWTRSKGEVEARQEWNVPEREAAAKKRYEARKVLDDPDATDQQRIDAHQDIEDSYAEEASAMTLSESIYRFDYKNLRWYGDKSTNEGVYCSDPSLAPDCP